MLIFVKFVFHLRAVGDARLVMKSFHSSTERTRFTYAKRSFVHSTSQIVRFVLAAMIIFSNSIKFYAHQALALLGLLTSGGNAS